MLLCFNIMGAVFAPKIYGDGNPANAFIKIDIMTCILLR